MIVRFIHTLVRFVEMFRMWQPQSAMGIRDVWYLDMSGMLRQASWFRCTLIICPLCLYGQVEGCRTGKDEGRWQ